MKRRPFLGGFLSTSLALTAFDTAFDTSNLVMAQAPTATAALGNQDAVTIMKLRGVNLGSWLLLEKWMNPQVSISCEKIHMMSKRS